MKSEENRWIDVHDDTVVEKYGVIRSPLLTPRDENLWRKSSQDRKLIAKYKTKQRDGHFHTIPQKQNFVYAKLIVQLVANDIFPKSTYSFKCFDGNVQNILNRFTQGNKSLVKKYAFHV